jgi:hypothetical protein
MVWSGPPRPLQQLDSIEFVECNAPPVSRRPRRFQAALTFPAELIAEHAKLSFFVPAKPMRTEKAVKAVISTRYGLPALHCPAQDPIHIIFLSGTASRYNRHASRLLRPNS